MRHFGGNLQSCNWLRKNRLFPSFVTTSFHFSLFCHCFSEYFIFRTRAMSLFKKPTKKVQIRKKLDEEEQDDGRFVSLRSSSLNSKLKKKFRQYEAIGGYKRAAEGQGTQERTDWSGMRCGKRQGRDMFIWRSISKMKKIEKMHLEFAGSSDRSWDTNRWRRDANQQQGKGETRGCWHRSGNEVGWAFNMSFFVLMYFSSVCHITFRKTHQLFDI